MEKFSEEQIKDAKEFAEFYIDLIENHRESFNFHLSDEALLDWFGQTVKGIKNIGSFIKANISNVSHQFPNFEPCHNIGYRESHVVKYSPIKQKPTSIASVKTRSNQEKTPPNNLINPGCSKRLNEEEQGQGDGLHNSSNSDELSTKRLRLIDESASEKCNDDDVCCDEELKIFNITSNGHIEFRRKSSKKYQRETKWSRPCRFQVAYSKTSAGYLIHLIIYQGNMKCRRNLLKEFEAAEQEN